LHKEQHPPKPDVLRRVRPVGEKKRARERERERERDKVAKLGFSKEDAAWYLERKMTLIVVIIHEEYTFTSRWFHHKTN